MKVFYTHSFYDRKAKKERTLMKEGEAIKKKKRERGKRRRKLYPISFTLIILP